MSDKEGVPAPDTGIIFYQTEDGPSWIQVRLSDGTVWLSQRLLAELCQVSNRTISEHIINIYSDHELLPEATIRKFRLVQTEGSRRVERLVDFYNLDMILAIGYRVRSHRGVQFRRWATARMREYIVKGFVLDDERLKGKRAPGQDYFDELLERIRDIRASEKRFYQKVRDIYALAIDYDTQAERSQWKRPNVWHWSGTRPSASGGSRRAMPLSRRSLNRRSKRCLAKVRRTKNEPPLHFISWRRAAPIGPDLLSPSPAFRAGR